MTSRAAGSVTRVTIDNPYRLPRNVRPIRYDLTLEPDLASASFIGSVAITIEVSEAIDAVVLNAAELDISRANVVIGTGDTVESTNITINETTERATIAFGSTLPVGTAVMHCEFTGILNDKLRGFYRSTYTDDAGVEHTIATTQFESTQARRAFPCFDEPDFKAVFGVTLVVQDNLTAVSCSNVTASEQLGDGRRRDQFGDTMLMSTYLLAFIVGELEITEPVDVGGVPLRIVHVPGKGHLTNFGLEAGAFSLEWLVDYYGIPYPGDKLDLVAVPDFAFGAMENLGCVTFRETLLLADPKTSTQVELTRIVDVIAHEIAHMWFGDLVTMNWWNGIWLKEAFATFMQVATTDAFRPGWHRWDTFSLERGAAFDTDALASTRPIEYPVVSPEDAEGMYDVLTYEKGAAVVRMLEQFLEPAAFQAGTRLYLERYSYANTETTDLWDALEDATGAPVRSTMDSWIFQGGHPIIEVTASETGIDLRQRQFTYARGDSDVLWNVPLIMRASVDGAVVERRHLLETETASIDFGATPDWVVVNAGGHGFYRVRYEPSLLQALASSALENLPPAERYGIVDDTFAAVIAGEADAAEFLELATEMGSETDLGVWRRMLGGIAQLHSIADQAGRHRLSKLVRDLATTALGILGFEPADDEPPLDRELRAVLFQHAGGLGQDQLVQTKARAIVEELVNDPGSVEPNLATAAMQVVAANGTVADYERFVSEFRAADTPQAEQRFLNALIEFPDRELFDRTLELARTEVRSQNAPFLLMGAMHHLDHGAAAWQYVSGHWDELTAKFPENSIPRLVGGIRSLSTAELADEVDAFLDAHPIPQGTLTVAQHRERMRINVALRAREGKRLG